MMKFGTVKKVFSLVVMIGIIVAGLLLFFRNPYPLGFSGASEAAKVYFVDNISDAHKLVIDKFNAVHRGSIEVVPVNLPFDKFSTNERKELLARSLRSKSDRIDIFAVDYIWVPRFARWSEPLDDYFTMSDRAQIVPYALQSCIYESTLVSLPLYIDIGMIYYRRDIIQRLPNASAIEQQLKESITWDQLERLAPALGYQNRPFYIFQANDYEGLVCNYFELLAGLDNKFFQANTIDLMAPTAQRALQQLVDFVHVKHLSPLEVTGFDENASYRYTLDHDAVFVRGWPNFVENFQNSYPDTAKLRLIGRAALPHYERQTPTSVYGGWNIMISRYSPKKKEALEFLRFLETEEVQKQLFETGGYIPVNKAVYLDSAYLSRQPELTYYSTLINRGFHRPAMIEYTKVSDIISHFVRRAITKELTVDEALRRASEMISSNKVLIK